MPTACSQTELYDEILTSEQMYRLELTTLPDAKELSEQEKDAIVARARSGDRTARNTLIASLLHRVEGYARMYHCAYGWASPHLSYLDLVEAGNIALAENIDRVLSSGHSNPYAYLTIAAYQAVRLNAKRYSSMIVTPYTVGVTPIPVDSLDAPLVDEDEATLYDLVADELEDASRDEEMYSHTIDYGPLYNMLDTLGSVEYTVIVHHYGLFGNAPTGLQEIDRNILKRKGASSTRTNALDRLHHLLGPAYPQFRTSAIRPKLRPPGEVSDKELTESQVHRLDQAYATLVTRSEKITQDRLRIEAHVAPHVARKYLRKRAEENPQETVEQRLERVYNDLIASGEAFTIEQFAKRANVRVEVASGYVGSRREPRLSQDERLEQAYTEMAARGEKITVQTLSKASGVEQRKLRSWLEARRLAEGMTPVRHGGAIHWTKVEGTESDGVINQGPRVLASVR